MNPEFLQNELERALEAEARSDEQLRGLLLLIDKASTPNPDLCATDCSKLVGSALALNERLRDRRTKLEGAIRAAATKMPM